MSYRECCAISKAVTATPPSTVIISIYYIYWFGILLNAYFNLFGAYLGSFIALSLRLFGLASLI